MTKEGQEGVKHTRVPTIQRSQGPVHSDVRSNMQLDGFPGWLFYFYTGTQTVDARRGGCAYAILLDSRRVCTVYGCPRTRERPGMVTAGPCFEADSLVPAFPCWAIATEGWPSSSLPFQPSGSQARFTYARRVRSISRLFNQLENTIWKILDESSR